MKKIACIFIITLVFTGQSLAQAIDPAKPTPDQAYINFRNIMNKLLDEYNCMKTSGKQAKAVQNQVLNDNLYGIYEAIIPNAQGLSSNGSAFTYAHNASKQTLGLSAFFPRQNKRTFLQVGVYTEGSDGIFNMYSSSSWNNNTAFNIGISKVLRSSQFFKPEHCCETKPKRKEYANSLLSDYAKSLAVDIVALKKDSLEIAKRIDLIKNLNEVKEIVGGDTTNLLKVLGEIKAKIERYTALIDTAHYYKYRTELEAELTKFDKKNDLVYGYNVIWWNLNGSLVNTHLQLTDSSFNKNKRSVNHPTLKLNSSVMYSRVGIQALQYLSLETEVKRGSFMDDPTLSGDLFVQNDENVQAMVMMENGRIVGGANDLQKPVWQYTVSLYYANFFAAKQSFGFSARLAHNNAFDKKYAPDYRRNYSLIAGPVFRILKEEDFAKATFGINAGWANVPYSEKAKDHFSVQAYVAVPFKAFIKKTK